MGKLTSLVPEAFPTRLDTAPLAMDGFSLATAQIMAWASQLAYEAAEPNYLAELNERFRWRIADIVQADPALRADAKRARGYVAQLPNACVISFCGTEPDQAMDWMIDLDAFRKPEGASQGTQAAYAKVADGVRHAVAGTSGPVFITGHSLGGAYAVLCAHDLVTKTPDTGGRLRGVYTFGMPRIANEEFAVKYNSALDGQLGRCTYRLIHGDDAVSQVPPAGTKLFDHRHVGRRLACARDGRFGDALEPPVIEAGRGDFEAALGVLNGKFADWGLRLAEMQLAFAQRALGRLLPRYSGYTGPAVPSFLARSEQARIGANFLPPAFRDHLMDCYLRALGYHFPGD